MRAKYRNVQDPINNYNQVEVIALTEYPDFLILSETHLIRKSYFIFYMAL